MHRETHPFRCLARANDLDGTLSDVIPRTKVLTDEVVCDFELGDTWDQYGMIGDVVVSPQINFDLVFASHNLNFYHSHSPTNFRAPIYTS